MQRMRTRWAGLAVSLLLLSATGAACGSSAGNKSDNAAGVDGSVVLTGTCPVIPHATGCRDRPFTARVQVLDQRGAHVGAIVRSDRAGHFRVSLDPGAYTLVPINPHAGVPPTAQPLPVHVSPGRYTHVVIRYDAGVR
jgi:hypothetical protein